MTDLLDWQEISHQIEKAINQPFSIKQTEPVSGGCINSAFILEGENQSFFIKLNRQHLRGMFEAEFSGLQEIAQSKTVKVPTPIVCGVSGNHSFLVMEKLVLGSGTVKSSVELGQQLAALHQIKQPYFGWHQNNTIGSTEQINDASNDWLSFWKNHRLGFQLSLAEKGGYRGSLIRSGELLAESLDCFFRDYTPQPSLLHGDLWSGNASVTEDRSPVIYDPACYYGDREADIAMTELFGGFGADFYAAYDESFPLHQEYLVRKKLYNLYHILNHLNLFGEGYLHQAESLIDSLLAEIS